MTGDNRRQIFNILVPGDAINMASLRMERAPISVEALTDIVVCVFSRWALEDYVHGDIRRIHQLERYWLNAIASMKERVLDLGRRSSTQRIARLILNLEERLRERNLAKDGIFEFPLRYHPRSCEQGHLIAARTRDHRLATPGSYDSAPR
jgi:CRP/FNR family transcriptional regulator, anaerobic regulatory protein